MKICKVPTSAAQSAEYWNYPFTAMMSFENNPKVQSLKPLGLFVFSFALPSERIFMKTHSTEGTCVIRPENTVCRHIRAAFSPETLQALAVKGLKTSRVSSEYTLLVTMSSYKLHGTWRSG